MKSQKTLRVVTMLVSGLLMFSFCLIEDVCGDDQDQTQDHTQDRLHGEDCDCLCTCCQDSLCTCCKNCLCPCCQDDFCTSRENRLLICEDESFRARVENQFRVRNMYLKAGEGGEEETSGNCLSYPVIWADGSVALRGQYGYPSFLGNFVEDPDTLIKWYEQQDDLNAWQAESHSWNEASHGLLDISGIVWGIIFLPEIGRLIQSSV